MRTKGAVAVGVVLALAVTGCSSGAAKVLVQRSETPFASAAPTASASSTGPTASASARSHRPRAATAASPTASTVAATAAPRRTAAPAPTRSPVSTPKATASQLAACSGGATSTIQMTSPYRFVPSTLTIKRCDSVKAVYADGTGAPHNWKGPSWSSPDMSSSGQSYTYRFTSTGTFNFFCSYHQSLGMTGTITVR